jgi:hypothetical protein
MTPEQQRIAIAEACGWTCCGCVEGCTPHGLSPSFSVHDYSFKEVMAMEVPIGDLPDYLNDLNAMHEAEKIFDDALYCRYISELCTLTINDNNSMYMATAAQRAEAFLRAIDKWTTNETNHDTK